MTFLDRFESKKSQLPAGAEPATRRRRRSSGGGLDEGYTVNGAFYLLDGSMTTAFDYSEPPRAVESTPSSSYSCEGGEGGSHKSSPPPSYDSGLSPSSSYDSGASSGSSDSSPSSW